MDPLQHPEERPEQHTQGEHSEEQQARRAYEEAREEGRQAYESAWGKAREGFESMKHQASQSLEQGREKLKQSARGYVADQKNRGAGSLRRFSHAVHETAQRLRDEGDNTLAEYTDAAANQVDKAAHYIEQREPSDLMHDAEGLIRRQAGLFIGGMFVAGVIAARMIRSSSRTRDRSAAGGQGETTHGQQAGMLPEPPPGHPGSLESTHIPPGAASRFNPPPEPGEQS